MTAANAPAVRVLSPFAQVDLRLDPSDRALVERVGDVLGLGLPTIPNTVTQSGGGARTALWLGPDEWLILGRVPDAVPAIDPAPGEPSPLRDLLDAVAREVAALDEAIRRIADDAFVSTVDVSQNRVAIEIAGRCARDLLAFGCALDLGDRAFPPGRCAQTNLARANVILWRIAPDAYRILVRPSFLAYLEAWLEDAEAGLA